MDSVSLILLSILCLLPSEILAKEIKEEKIEYSFKEASDYLAKAEYKKAIELYEGIISRESLRDTSILMRKIQGNSLTELVFSYAYLNQYEEILLFIKKIKQENKFWIAKNSPRDIGVSLAYLYHITGQHKEALSAINEVLEQKADGRPEALLSFDYAVAFTIYSYDRKYIKQAIVYGVKAADLLKKTKHDPVMLASILANLIWMSQQAGELDNALAYYNSLEDLVPIEQKSHARSIAETAVVELYSEWGIEDEVDRHLYIALDISRGHKIAEIPVRTYSVFTLQNLLSGKIEEACMSLDSTKHYNKLANISAYDDMIKKYELAILLASEDSLNINDLKQAEALINRWENEALSYIDIRIAWLISNSLIEKGEKKLAKDMLESTLYHLKDNYSLRHSKDIYESLASLYADEEQHKLSREYYERATEVNKLFVERRNAQTLNKFRVEQEVSELEKELLNISTHWKFIIWILASVFLFIIIYIIYKYIKKGKRHQKDIAKFAIKRKTQPIRTQTLTLSTEDDVQNFRKQFTEHYPEFIHKLRCHSPKISNSEELLCMLIKQNLSIHEISAIFGIKVESVHNSRSRLKRKLNLENNIQFDEWIKSLD